MAAGPAYQSTMNNNAGNSRIESLKPIGLGDRVFNLLSYTLMLWASLIVIQGFVLGQALLPPQGNLSLVQGAAVILVSALIMTVFMSLNGQAGLQYGIPFCIQARASFGIRGARLPELIRLLPAIVWYGFGTWIAALAMDGIIRTLVGFTADGIQLIYFIAFLIVQTWFAARGIRMMKWFTVGASIALVIIIVQMLFSTLKSEQFEISETWRISGDWGWSFWTGVNATVGILVAVMVSASDLTRYLENKQRSMWLGHLFGIIPPLGLMMFLGFVSAVTTGQWDPIQALMQLSPGPVVMILMLVFILVAQFSTNLTINILPPAFIFEELFGFSWQKGVILTGILASLSFPWVLLESGAHFVSFINYYTAFFGPLLGCMLAQRWLEKDPLSVKDLYDETPESRYWHIVGLNPAAIISTLGASTVTMVWWLQISWLVGLPLGIVGYIVFDRLFNALSNRSDIEQGSA